MRTLVLGCLLVAFTVGLGGQQQVRDPKAPQTPQQVGAGVIAGVVVTADAGRPVKRASVDLRGGPLKVGRTVETGADGQFRFTGLPPGEYSVAASKGGYVETIFGQRIPGSGRLGTPISLQAGQELNRISLPLVKGGVITGVVLDETGEPAFGTPVRAYRWVMKAGERTLQATDMGIADDRGIYRIPGLLPGDYVVAALPGGGGRISVGGDGVSWSVKMDGEMALANTISALKSEIKSANAYAAGLVPSDSGAATGFATLYYPGTTEGSAASSIAVAAGTESAGIDFRLQLVPLGRVTGQVIGPSGPAPRIEVRLIDRTQPPGNAGRSAKTDSEGRFLLADVPPGQYVLVAAAGMAALAATATSKSIADSSPGASAVAGDRAKEKALALQLALQLDAEVQRIEAAGAGASQLWAMSDISSDGRDLSDVQLVLQPGITLSGRVEVESSGAVAPNLARLSVTLKTVGQQIASRSEPPPAPVDADGRFTVRGAMPGRYRIAISGALPAGYSIKSAIFGGRDVLDTPFEFTGNENPSGGVVTLTARTTEVGGSVQSASGQPAPEATVIVFAADERFWLPDSRRIQTARPGSDGRFVVKGLPPGDYRLVAIEDVEPGRWFDPAYLRSLGGFSTFALAEGGKATADVRIR